MSTRIRPFGRFTGFLVAVVGVAVVTAILYALGNHINPTTVALIFFLFVVVVAILFESRAALVSSLLSASVLNFFFLPPYYTLSITDAENWVSFFVFLATAITVGQLSARAHERAVESEQLYSELQGAIERVSEAEALKRSEKLKSALLDAVTHDLRTPLTSIKASVTMLIDENQLDPNERTIDSKARTELLEVINEETDRLNTFVETMVELARLQSGDTLLRRSTVTAEEIVVKAARRAKSIRGTHKFKSQIEPNLPPLSVDARALVEAIHNLLDNAAKYSPPDTTIFIGASRSDGNVRFVVEDEGPGIPQAERESVFERFYRSDQLKRGLGMGLSIVRGIIEAHGGQIWIESGEKGARFVIDLPAEANGR